MATLTNLRPSLMDLAAAMTEDGKIAAVIELLQQELGVLEDAVVIEGNMTAGNMTVQRSGLPTIAARKLYKGVPPDKTTRIKVTDTIGIYPARSEIDVDLAELNGNTPAFRLSEANGFLQAMKNTIAQTIFYGNTDVTPEGFLGLSPRYSQSAAPVGQNIIKAGGAGNDNQSIWLVGWGPQAVTLFYPKGSQAGLEHQDLGEIDAFDASGFPFRAVADIWKWKVGMTVADWRYAVRICNISTASLLADTTGSTVKLIEYMIRAIARIPMISTVRPVFYCNRTVYEMLGIQAMNKSSSALGLREARGQFETMFMGVPIHLCDSLLSTEATVP